MMTIRMMVLLLTHILRFGRFHADDDDDNDCCRLLLLLLLLRPDDDRPMEEEDGYECCAVSEQ
jgi:hypothetical protein